MSIDHVRIEDAEGLQKQIKDECKTIGDFKTVVAKFRDYYNLTDQEAINVANGRFKARNKYFIKSNS